MDKVIYPRSPHETMAGWTHLPRYIDKIRFYLAGKLHPDYHNNLGKGFDGSWLAAAGLTHEQFVEVVKGTITDGEVCDWVSKNVKAGSEQKAAHREQMLNYPKAGDRAMEERLKQRKANAGIAHRDDIRTFVDFIDADEGRL